MKKKKILVTFIESGFGHITSAQSISDSLKKKYENNFEIENCYIMHDSKRTEQFEKFLTLATKTTNKVHGFGFFIFSFMELCGGQKFLRFTHKTFFKTYVKATLDAFLKHNPDVIVSTHYFLTYCANEYCKKHNKNCLIITYNPDNNVHCWWDDRAGIFITNNGNATNEAINKRKFKEENVKTVSFTCRKELLNCNESKEFYRKKYNIDKDTFCVIVADGGYALGKCKKVTNELLKTKKKLTIISIAGKNEKIYNYFIKKNVNNNIKFLPMQFVPEIYELYKAADLFITKAGPNSILDCVFMNTPILVDYYPHPIEKSTKKLFIDKLNCGLYISSPKKIRKMVELFIDSPNLLDPFIENTYKINKFNNGADEVADIIYNAVRENNEA